MASDWQDDSEKLTLLGEPTAEFVVGPRALLRNFVSGSLLILVGVGIETLFFVIGLHGQIPKILILGVFCVLMGTMLVVRAWQSRGLRVLVFPEGVVRIRRGQAQAIFWDEVDQVWQKKTEGFWARIWKGSLVFILQKPDLALQFDDSLPGLKKLGELILRNTLPFLLPRTLEAFEAGESLEFGKLKVNLQGLSHDQGTLAWADLQDIQLTADALVIYKKGKWTKWFQATVSEIPNFHVLPALARHGSYPKNLEVKG